MFLLSFLAASFAGPLWAADGDEMLKLYFDESEMVKTATRSTKPIRQIAENVTIITAEEIAEMRAHTLSEVLERQPGVSVMFFSHDFLSDDFIRLMGTREHHVLVLLDGARINLNSGGHAITNFIPLGIIKRIEIIKGAASSTWGSALGGVINIITKDGGKSTTPIGSVNASYGEGQSRELSADVAGSAVGLRYYLYGGNIDSKGLELDRYGERGTAYGKLQVKLGGKSTVTVQGGYSDPYWKSLNWSDAWGVTGLDIYEDIRSENLWGSIYLDSQLTSDISLHLSGQHFDNDYTGDRRSLGTGSVGGASGELIEKRFYGDRSNSFAINLIWSGKTVTTNLGFETSRSEMDYEYALGPMWGPSLQVDDPIREKRHGLYANATYFTGNLSVTPGLRYDYNSNSDEFVSPSLGITYLLANDLLVRGTIARGFTAPYLAAISHSPDLESETTWTYQAGLETSRIPFLRLKTTLFRHDLDNAWNDDTSPWLNTGSMLINGVEFEGITDELHGFTFTGNFSLAVRDPSEGDNDESYTANLICDYRNRDYGLRIQVAGHYFWMPDYVVVEDPSHDDFLWDVLIGKDITLSAVTGEIYLKAHNIFNGKQYWDVDYPNPERWVEAGVAFNF